MKDVLYKGRGRGREARGGARRRGGGQQVASASAWPIGLSRRSPSPNGLSMIRIGGGRGWVPAT